MNKQEFISLLEKRLFQLPQVEKEHLLNYYNETIEDRMEDGMSEAEAVASLDSIETIVKQVFAERDLQMEEEAVQAAAGNRKRGWKMTALVLLFPFWMTLLCMAFVVYLMLWILIAVLFCILLAFVCFLTAALWNLIPIWRMNAASGVVLLGSVLFIFGLLPLCWKLLRISIAWLKSRTGIWTAAIRQLFVKAVN